MNYSDNLDFCTWTVAWRIEVNVGGLSRLKKKRSLTAIFVYYGIHPSVQRLKEECRVKWSRKSSKVRAQTSPKWARRVTEAKSNLIPGARGLMPWRCCGLLGSAWALCCPSTWLATTGSALACWFAVWWCTRDGSTLARPKKRGSGRPFNCSATNRSSAAWKCPK